MIIGKPITLSTGAALPTEFRLFTKGWNDTENGRFLFDDVAAKSVMAAYAAWGVDLAIDVEHSMLEVQAGAPDPTARDARGWCKLELRSDGSLWAVSVTWTSDGATRLKNKTERSVSPAFDVDPQTKRVRKLINIAIVAMPATHKTPALVAASRKGSHMNALDPANPITHEQATKIVGQVADVLGCEKTHSAISKALEAVFAAVTGDDTAGSEQLSASERAACKAQGCDVATFLRVKKALGAR